MDPNTPPRRFYLFTLPRSSSNLLVRILGLERQPMVEHRAHGGYFFMPTMQLQMENGTYAKDISKWQPDERAKIEESLKACAEELGAHQRRARENGKISFIKEHSLFFKEPVAETKLLHGDDATDEIPWRIHVPDGLCSAEEDEQEKRSEFNKTIVSDKYLQSIKPVFLVRHPALFVPSYYRTRIDLLGAEETAKKPDESALSTSIYWTRMLYDFYAQYFEQQKSSKANGHMGEANDVQEWPIVIDADQIVNEPEVMHHLCELTGLDPKEMQFQWEPMGKDVLEKLGTQVSRMLDTLSVSTGIRKDKTSKDLDINVESEKWKKEFGEDAAANIERWVKLAMPHYEYLTAKRLQPKKEV